MVIALARVPVSSPTFTPLSYGLLSAADIVTEGSSRWTGGIEFIPDACEEAGITTSPCPATGSIHKSPNVTGVDVRGADPFTVFADILCSPVGFDEDEFKARTTAALTNGEARAAERVFWTGVAGAATVNPHLAEDTAVTDARGVLLQSAASLVITGAAISVTRALGLLEGSLAECYGGEGVIHVPREALAHLGAVTNVVRDGQRLRTLSGNIIAAYSSNNKEGPTGAEATLGEGWFYATGALSIRRSGIDYVSAYTEAVDRSENTMVYIAERTYVVNWDCCHFAVRVALA
jgi:hypothetical protein